MGGALEIHLSLPFDTPNVVFYNGIRLYLRYTSILVLMEVSYSLTVNIEIIYWQ